LGPARPTPKRHQSFFNRIQAVIRSKSNAYPHRIERQSNTFFPSKTPITYAPADNP
jgi:hypothetical protein